MRRGASRPTPHGSDANLAKEKGRQFGGLKVWSGEDPPPENNLEEHIGRFRLFDLDQTVTMGFS
jgi:hypothetical protein